MSLGFRIGAILGVTALASAASAAFLQPAAAALAVLAIVPLATFASARAVGLRLAALEASLGAAEDGDRPPLAWGGADPLAPVARAVGHLAGRVRSQLA